MKNKQNTIKKSECASKNGDSPSKIAILFSESFSKGCEKNESISSL